MPLHVMQPKDLTPYLSGEKLLADDATPTQLDAWFAGEMNGYADMMEPQAAFHAAPDSSMAALNRRHWGNWLAGKTGLVGLALGPGDGKEVLALAPHMARWLAVEPAKVYHKPDYYTCPVEFVPVNAKGTLAVPDTSVDVVLSFSVLHHIANVSFVLSELHRVLKPGGLLLVREPIVTMGTWGALRPGLTPNERGLPEGWLRATLLAQGWQLEEWRPAVFSPLLSLVNRLGFHLPFSSRAYVGLDAALAWLTKPLARYHRPRWWHKCAPSAVLVVARKALV
jgi:SAM-dependent methyltransferase